ncbi:MAG: hypothetical protein LBF80_01085 [Spirochaetaceae bacterium]|jgi:hypothetical protein|nr:hypothetical protein [Spirochaetaceae bacterium]
MNKHERLREISELQTELKRKREQCKKCDAWECGHCAESKWNLINKIERLKKGGAA